MDQKLKQNALYFYMNVGKEILS